MESIFDLLLLAVFLCGLFTLLGLLAGLAEIFARAWSGGNVSSIRLVQHLSRIGAGDRGAGTGRLGHSN